MKALVQIAAPSTARTLCPRCGGSGYVFWSLVFAERVYCGDCPMGLDVARADQQLAEEARRRREGR